jgi:hypothetical protein
MRKINWGAVQNLAVVAAWLAVLWFWDSVPAAFRVGATVAAGVYFAAKGIIWFAAKIEQA